MSASSPVEVSAAFIRSRARFSFALGESQPVRAFCGGLHAVTAVTFIQVIRRLFTPGISVEDTMTWWGAWRVVLEGQGRRVYQPAAQMLTQRRWVWVAEPADVAAWAFPPPHTFLLSPLALLTPWALYAALTVASALVWLATVRSMARWAQSREVPWSPDAVAVFVAAALSFSPAMGTIRYGSFSVLVVGALWQLVLVVEMPQQSHSQRYRAALWLAFAALKPQMILFLGLGLLRRRFKIVALAGSILSGLTVLICTLVGWGLIGDWIAINQTYSRKNVGAALDRMWTIRGVLSRSFGSGPVIGVVWKLMLVATLVALAILWHRARNSERLLAAVAASLALQCFGFPYQSSYDAVLLVPAVLVAIEVARRFAPALARTLSATSVFAACFVLTGAWNEQLPGLTWRVPLPAVFVWAAVIQVVAIAVRTSASRADVGRTVVP